MKYIYVLRPGVWDYQKQALTQKTRKRCKKLKNQLGNFQFSIAAPFPHALATARLLSDIPPKIDMRATILHFTPYLHEQLVSQSKTHPLGMTGVLLDTPDLMQKMSVIGTLVTETLEQLSNNGKALFVVYDEPVGHIEEMEKNNGRIDYTYPVLEGYIIDENLQQHPLRL